MQIKPVQYPQEAPAMDPEMYARLKAEMLAKLQGYNMPGYQSDPYMAYDEMSPPWLRQGNQRVR